jgi:hypothetical protein
MTELFLRPDEVTMTHQHFWEKHQDYVRYCDFPGEKLALQTDFTINGNLLDTYTHMSYVYEWQFFLKEDKKQCYYECVGQQWPKQAQYPSDGTKQSEQQYYDGLQTPTLLLPQATFLTPLKFWFNKCLSQSFLSAAIPFG